MRKRMAAWLLLGAGIAAGQHTAPGKTDAQRAVAAVLRHYVPSDAMIAETGKALDAKGSWSTALNRPEICPADGVDPCVRVHYIEPGTTVDCAWVVLLKGGPGEAKFLDENADAAKYLLRKLTPEETKNIMGSARMVIYPPIAKGKGDGATWEVTFVVSANGTSQSYLVPGKRITDSTFDGAGQWTFAPFLVGGRAVAYQMRVKFTAQSGSFQVAM